MEDKHLSHLIQLKQATERWLRDLELKESQRGEDIPAHIIIEIHHLKERIKYIESQIEAAYPTYQDIPSNNTSFRAPYYVNMVFNGNESMERFGIPPDLSGKTFVNVTFKNIDFSNISWNGAKFTNVICVNCKPDGLSFG